ncbi:MAG: hypothetical protein JKY94_04990 [Rhodobacteraceae bacterium]|nr:hypothetical protein [Paracoccaceae bacterium]
MTHLASQPDTSIRWVKPAAIFALIFGAMTIFSGGTVLFGTAEAQAMAGNYFRFVVWFNFLAGGLYVLAAIGLWRQEIWTVRLATFIAITTAVVALGFAIMVLQGQAFEMRTVGALAFRFGFWAVIAVLARRTQRCL